MKPILITFLLLITLSGCASNPDEIQATYVSPMRYQDHNCKQISMEMDYVGQRTSELYGQLEEEASSDSAQMGLGLVLFWPALFFLEGGDGPRAAEYARLKGEHEALHKAAIQKECQMASLPPSPEEIIKSKEEEKKRDEENRPESPTL